MKNNLFNKWFMEVSKWKFHYLNTKTKKKWTKTWKKKFHEKKTEYFYFSIQQNCIWNGKINCYFCILIATLFSYFDTFIFVLWIWQRRKLLWFDHFSKWIRNNIKWSIAHGESKKDNVNEKAHDCTFWCDAKANEILQMIDRLSPAFFVLYFSRLFSNDFPANRYLLVMCIHQNKKIQQRNKNLPKEECFY